MSANTSASGLLAGRTHSVRGSDWQANSRSALSRSPYIRTHEMYGVPGGTPTCSGTGLAHVAITATVKRTTETRYVRMMRPLEFTAEDADHESAHRTGSECVIASATTSASPALQQRWRATGGMTTHAGPCYGLAACGILSTWPG